MQEASGIRRLPRRTVLAGAFALGLSAAAAEASLSPTPVAAGTDTTYELNGWRFCVTCFALYRVDIWVDRARCPRTNSWHQAAGWTFQLTYNSNAYNDGETFWGQGGWRNCYKCAQLYWSPSTSQRCPWDSGGHAWRASGNENRQFLMKHDIGSPPSSQNLWRYCYKCSVMFFNGYADRGEYGLCAFDRIGGHAAAGYDFNLYVSAYT